MPDVQTASLEGRFLTFFLGSEAFGLEILEVSEIVGLLPITRVSGMPSWLDLRRRFGMEPIEPTSESCIVVAALDETSIGLLVDRVSEVSEIRGDTIDPAPEFGGGVRDAFLLGIARSEDRTQFLLDIQRGLSGDDQAALGRLLEE